MIERRPWTYGSSIVNRDYLKGGQSFDDLAKEIEAAVRRTDKSKVRFRMEPKNGKYSGQDRLLARLQCKRAGWWIPLDTVLLDKFFNGLMGIRAQYYVSPYFGQLMNQRLLSLLVEPLIEYAKAIEPTVDMEFLSLSLCQASAKVWISELDLQGKKIIRASELNLNEEEIQNDWLDLARGVKSGEFNDQYQLYCAAINGVRAPMADQLEVKSAWITALDKCEYVTPDKRDRDLQLFMFGFT